MLIQGSWFQGANAAEWVEQCLEEEEACFSTLLSQAD